MKYIKVFNTDSEYQIFKDGEDYVTPNVSLINDNNAVCFNPIPPPLAGDVAYWDGSNVKTTPLSKWNESLETSGTLGTAIGVVVVPKGFAPDGKARIASLYGVDADGNQSTSHVGGNWGGYGTDTSLTNYTMVPTTDNAGSTSTGSASAGYLPSDKFTGAQSFVDSKAKYSQTSNLIPSPYLGDEPNPDYYKIITGNNALRDFNGLRNTRTLVGLGTDYAAANMAWKYKDGLSGLQWYLPAMGGLGYIMPRFNEINATITALGGLAVGGRYFFCSSSEYNNLNAYRMNASNGNVNYSAKSGGGSVRPFAIIE